MLHAISLKSPSKKTELYEQNKEASWVVSNFDTKAYLQDITIQQGQTLAGDHIQRALEYWSWLFTANCPEWTVISESLFYILIEEWFESVRIETKYKDIQMFSSMMTQFVPLLSEDKAEMLDEWLKEDTERQWRLSGWVQRAREFWQYLKSKKKIPKSMFIPVLLEKESIYFGDAEIFYFDLGADIKHQEAELLERLSNEKDVYVLLPDAEICKKYISVLSVYNKLFSHLIEESPAADDEPSELPAEEDSHQLQVPATVSTYRCPSVVHEVRAAVAQIRQWVASGIPLEAQAVLCPDIETYWDLLREYLLVEGVPFQKSYMKRMVSLPQVQKWLSCLQVRLDKFQQSSLETFLYSDLEGEQAEEYHLFRKKFFHLYSEKDAQETYSLPATWDMRHQLSLQEFLKIAYELWVWDDVSFLNDLADKMAEDFAIEDQMSFELWCKYTELHVSQVEKRVSPESEGLFIGNVASAEWLGFSHMIILGCSQSLMSENIKSPASIYDILSAERDLGFYLERPERNKKTFELHWLLSKQHTELLLMCPQSDIEGKPQVASSFWLEVDHRTEDYQPPGIEPRWSQLMQSSVEQISREFSLNEHEGRSVERHILREDDIEQSDVIEAPFERGLSATSLTNIARCPFKFFASKVLRLQEPEYLDLDVDALQQGQLLHKVIEDVFNHKNGIDLKTEELDQIYDRCLAGYEAAPSIKDFWRNEKTKHLKILGQFLSDEKERRELLPDMTVVGHEVPVRGFISATGEGLSLSTEAQEGAWLFRGSIDRVDQDSNGNKSIVDYKFKKSAAIKAFKNWTKNEQYQLALYSLAVENGLCPEEATGPVAVSNYYFLKEGKRGSGFILSDKDHHLTTELENKSQQLITGEKKEGVLLPLLQEAGEQLGVLQRGEYAPKPKREDVCEYCRWGSLCRAPHLRD